MPAKMTTTYREHERGSVITGVNYRKQYSLHHRLNRQNQSIDNNLATAKKEWTILPPEYMVISYQGLIVSIPHVIGRELIRRREAAILEHDVTVDAVIDGEIEDMFEAMDLNASSEVAA